MLGGVSHDDHGDLLSVLAHQWLNMIAVIGGSASTLRDSAADLDPVDARRLVTIIARQADALEDSLLDVLRGARPEVRVALQELQRS
jgi:signal transduction histidine kinase